MLRKILKTSVVMLFCTAGMAAAQTKAEYYPELKTPYEQPQAVYYPEVNTPYKKPKKQNIGSDNRSQKKPYEQAYYSDNQNSAQRQGPYKQFYITVRGGVSTISNKLDMADFHGGIPGKYAFSDTVGALEGTFGFFLTRNLRIEGSYTYFLETDATQDKYVIQRNFGSGLEDSNYVNEVDVQLFMLNLAHEFDPLGEAFMIRPYFGGGLGLARVTDERLVKSKVSSNQHVEGKKNESTLAAQVYVGLSFPITDWLEGDLNVRGAYINHENLMYSISGMAGLRFSF